MNKGLNAMLEALEASGTLSCIDSEFGRFISRRCHGKDADMRVPLAAALASAAATVHGSVCLDISMAPSLESLLPGIEKVESVSLPHPLPETHDWLESLRGSPAVGDPGDFKPLILDPSGRLYLRRYWEYESFIASEIRRRASQRNFEFDIASLSESLNRHFKSPPCSPDWRKTASLSALTGTFSIIAGGPGTGKTSTVTSIIALLLEQCGTSKSRVVFAAPTGKAAARLKEAVRKAKSLLDCDDNVKRMIPEDASTVHRLLEPIEGGLRFRRGKGNPIAADILVVDEASMMPLSLMAKLLQAAAPDSRMILLGDKDQLASVEAGMVMADICDASFSADFSGAFRDFHSKAASETLPDTTLDGRRPPKAESPMADCAVMLRHSYRFHPGKGIGVLSRAVNSGDEVETLRTLRSDPSGEISFSPLPPPRQFTAETADLACSLFAKWSSASSLQEAFAIFDSFRILTPMRAGTYGSEAINATVRAGLVRKGLAGKVQLSRGIPIMILNNDFRLDLFNGDVGMIWPDATGRLKAQFPSEGGSFREFNPSRLPAHELAFAITIHKSQGSEFDEALIALPDAAPGMTREMLYTGITRAKRKVLIKGSEATVRDMLQKVSERRSGLKDAIL